MRLLRRPRPTELNGELAERRRLLVDQPESVKQAAVQEDIAWAKETLGEEEVRAVEALDEDAAKAAAAEELRIFKRRDPAGYQAWVASLPSEDIPMVRELEAEFGV